MVCFHPIKGYRSQGGRVTFSRRDAFIDRPVTVSCGQCRGCRRERAKQWAIRITHEAQLHEKNSFITLTYRDDELPPGNSLDKQHFPNFIKRFRKNLRKRSHDLNQETPETLRYFHCGEYGDDSGRPHYHACLFGQDFSEDRKLFKNDKRGYPLWTSKALDDLWQKGHSIIGALTFESAAYVARYIMKKQTGPGAEEHYHGTQPEYVTMSRRPGIGASWYEKFGDEIRRDDFCVVQRKKARPPRFYDLEFQKQFPEKYEATKIKRIRQAEKHQANNTPERLQVREEVQIAKERRLTRDLN